MPHLGLWRRADATKVLADLSHRKVIVEEGCLDVATPGLRAFFAYLHDKGRLDARGDPLPAPHATLDDRRHRYSTDTLWAGVHRLTERATATFTASGLAITYPPPALHVAQPRTPRPGVDLVAAFDALLTTTVARRAMSAPPGQVGVELSGGADSTNVALAVTDIGGDRVNSYGLLVTGDTGQQRRRVEIVRALGLHDVSIASAEYPPFAPGGPRALPHDPTGS